MGYSNTLVLAFPPQRGNSRVNTDGVTVDQHNQDGSYACVAESRHFLGKALPHELLTGTAAALRLFDANVAWLSPRPGKKAAGESFVLIVFAEDDDPGLRLTRPSL